jgi:hypothetical protein
VLQGQHSFISYRAQKRDLRVRPIRGWREFGIQQVWQKELLKEAVASLSAPPAFAGGFSPIELGTQSGPVGPPRTGESEDLLKSD